MTDDKNRDDDSEPRIIVDEDWKSQVEREKSELKNQADASAAGSGESTSESQPANTAAGSADSESANEEAMQLPPVSFSVLLSTLATQAMGCMGILPDPATGVPNVNRPLAKHFIVTIAMLEEKTKGNLTESEEVQVRDGLHQLRMIFLSDPGPAPANKNEPPSEPKKSTLELP